MSITDKEYVAFTTFTSTGVAKAGPVQPYDSRGKASIGPEPISGTAVVSAGDYDWVNQAIKTKNGWQRTLIRIVSKVFGRSGRVSDTAVLVTLD